MVIEAMKMEHAISAPYAGRVTAVHFARGGSRGRGPAPLLAERGAPPEPRRALPFFLGGAAAACSARTLAIS